MVRSFWKKIVGFFSPTAREAELRRQLANAQVKLHRAEFEKELLAAVNENLRQWLLANTAAAAALGQQLGAKEEARR